MLCQEHISLFYNECSFRRKQKKTNQPLSSVIGPRDEELAQRTVDLLLEPWSPHGSWYFYGRCQKPFYKQIDMWFTILWDESINGTLEVDDNIKLEVDDPIIPFFRTIINNDEIGFCSIDVLLDVGCTSHVSMTGVISTTL